MNVDLLQNLYTGLETLIRERRQLLARRVVALEPTQRFGTDKDEERAEKISLSVPNLWGLFPEVQATSPRATDPHELAASSQTFVTIVTKVC